MNRLERYLAQATAGLPGRERLRVREELRGSILERAAEHQVAGHSGAQALALALQEFGDAGQLASGLRRVHLWPRLSLWGGLGCAAILLTMLTIPPSSAQRVAVTTQGLIPRCLMTGAPAGQLSCSSSRSFWLSLRSLKAQLAAQGATVTTVQRPVPYPLLGRTAPVAGRPSTLMETSLQVFWSEADGTGSRFELPISDERFDAFVRATRAHPAAWLGAERVFTRDGETFLEGHAALNALLSTRNRPVTVERLLDGPVVRMGRLRLELGAPGQGIQAGELVQQVVSELLTFELRVTTFTGGGLLGQPGSVRPNVRGFPQQIRVRGQPGDLYAILRPITVQQVHGLAFDVVAVDAQGTLAFRSAQKSVRFTSDVLALSRSGHQKAAVALVHLGPTLQFGPGKSVAYRMEVPQRDTQP